LKKGYSRGQSLPVVFTGTGTGTYLVPELELVPTGTGTGGFSHAIRGAPSQTPRS